MLMGMMSSDFEPGYLIFAGSTSLVRIFAEAVSAFATELLQPAPSFWMPHEKGQAQPPARKTLEIHFLMASECCGVFSQAPQCRHICEPVH